MIYAISDGEILATSHSLADIQEIILDLTFDEIYAYWMVCVNIWGEDPEEVMIPTPLYFMYYVDEIPFF